MGFDGLFFGRADYQDIEQRNLTKTLEMIWKGSSSLGQCKTIFLFVIAMAQSLNRIRSSKLVVYGYFAERLWSTTWLLL